MARRRLTPAQPGYLAPTPAAAAPAGSGPAGTASAMVPPIAQVAGQSAEAAALRELTDGWQAARDEGRMVVEVPLSDIAPAHLLRDRIALDPEEMDALKSSIRTHGQRVPAEITPLPPVQPSGGDGTRPEGVPPYRFGLISGWRRLRALSQLLEETGDVRFSTLRALIRPAGGAAEAYVAMVEENEIRAGLSYYERARLVAEVVRNGVFPDQSAALRQLFAAASPAKRSKIGSFIDLHEALGDVLRFPAAIPERLGLALVSRLRLEGSAGRGAIAQALTKAAPASAEAELAVLQRMARPPKPVDVSRAKPAAPLAEQLGDGVTLSVARKGHTATLTLSGDRVDDALLERVRVLLRGLT